MKITKRAPDKGYLDCWLWVPKRHLPSVAGLKKGLTFQSISHSGEVTELVMYQEAEHHLLVPRALWALNTLHFPVVDCRPLAYTPVAFKSSVKLDYRLQNTAAGKELLPTGLTVQRDAFAAMNAAQGGVLQLACGKGKTAIACHHIATRGVPALVLLDNTQLLGQWREEAERFLTVPGGVGTLGAGKKDWQKGLVLGTYQTVASMAADMPEHIRRWFGGVYWDEGHHVGAPVFSLSISLFYGQRFSLTATPERKDGYHILASAHIGAVVFKDLSQPLTSRILFKWTGLALDETDTNCDVRDKNAQLHISKLFKYFGRWRARLDMILQDCRDAVAAGRRVIVVGNSVDEVVNLTALWTRGPSTPLITDLPYPTPQEVGESLTPLILDDADGKRLQLALQQAETALAEAKERVPPLAKSVSAREAKAVELRQLVAQYLVHKKCAAEYERRRKRYILALIKERSTAGALTRHVPVATRQEYCKTKQVLFSIMKYGKEGLDAPTLDTILVSTPFTQKGAMQQLLGRITGREFNGKKDCLTVIYQDDIGPIHGTCEKLAGILNGWPLDEGGPLKYETVGFPNRRTFEKVANLKEALNQ